MKRLILILTLLLSVLLITSCGKKDKENEITDVYQVGYKRGDTIIRFAMVKVAN